MLPRINDGARVLKSQYHADICQTKTAKRADKDRQIGNRVGTRQDDWHHFMKLFKCTFLVMAKYKQTPQTLSLLHYDDNKGVYSGGIMTNKQYILLSFSRILRQTNLTATMPYCVNNFSQPQSPQPVVSICHVPSQPLVTPASQRDGPGVTVPFTTNLRVGRG